MQILRSHFKLLELQGECLLFYRGVKQSPRTAKPGGGRGRQKAIFRPPDISSGPVDKQSVNQSSGIDPSRTHLLGIYLQVINNIISAGNCQESRTNDFTHRTISCNQTKCLSSIKKIQTSRVVLYFVLTIIHPDSVKL